MKTEQRTLLNIMHQCWVGLAGARRDEADIWNRMNGLTGLAYGIIKSAPPEKALNLVRELAALFVHRHEH